MKNNCIVSQVHIPDWDPQGNLKPEHKKHFIDLSISHMRKHNPDAYIILVGHGHEPFQSTIDQCNHFDWEVSHPQDSGGTLINNPAQFTYVSKGIKHAKESGFDYCIKTRGDSIIGLPNIASYCQFVLEKENKPLLLTQQTGDSLYKMGDCFMYGEIDFIDSIWDKDNPVFHIDGLRNTGANFVRHFTGEHPPKDYSHNTVLHNNMNWQQMLREYTAFRDIYRILFADFRWNYHDLASQGWENIREQIMNNEYDLRNILWGRKNGWHIFDDSGNLVSQHPVCSWSYSEKTFYGGQ